MMIFNNKLMLDLSKARAVQQFGDNAVTVVWDNGECTQHNVAGGMTAFIAQVDRDVLDQMKERYGVDLWAYLQEQIIAQRNVPVSQRSGPLGMSAFIEAFNNIAVNNGTDDPSDIRAGDASHD